MSVQSETTLENELIDQLASMGYQFLKLPDENALFENLKTQLEKHNAIQLNEKDFKLSDEEFKLIRIHLSGGNIFQKAQRLRDKYALKRDDKVRYLEFFNTKEWCKNLYQVSNQIAVSGKRDNRYDVTLLVNGIPLVQIELKRRGIELKKAYNQIRRYQHESYKDLFNYVQLFVISNGENTRYFSNNKEQNFNLTFYWADKQNNLITRLDKFTEYFLEKCFVSKIIARYIVLNQTLKCLMVLRPYQYHAVEEIIRKVNHCNQGGYIWHTTGSGKTLTSFKASQLLQENEKVEKVLFIIDRKDLDSQTTDEFEAFEKGCVSSSSSTKVLIKNLNDPKKKLIITTIQKLNHAVLGEAKQIAHLRDKRIVCIFDECHRSQFGDMHKRIKDFFNDTQMFGFTGTPIFDDNANKFRTTKDLFGDCLHRYTIKNAISDGNVLGFSVEYLGRYQNKCSLDIDVEDIDTKEILESPKRIEKITDYIIEHHAAKTKNKMYTAMLAAPNIDTALRYYDFFNQKEHDLKVATIFTWAPNEEEKASKEHSRDALERIMLDYNQLFPVKQNFTTDNFDGYYKDIAKRVKRKEIDILIVVNMFLTGFDSKTLNTLYVDKNLNYHGLIQAFSRTNRIHSEQKPFGNIVCFRNLKTKTDEAIKLFSNEEANENVLMDDYETYVEKFNLIAEDMLSTCPTPDAVNLLVSEQEKANYVQQFRELMRVMARLTVFDGFSWQDLKITEQGYENYKTKYVDIYQDSKETKEKISVLDDIDFELELLRVDKINVDYILNLLHDLDVDSPTFEADKLFVLKQLDSSPTFKSKRELIDEFIEKNLPFVKDKGEIPDELDNFFIEKRLQAIDDLAKDENVSAQALLDTLKKYEWSEKVDTDLLKTSYQDQKLKFAEKRTKFKRLHDKFVSILDKFNLHWGD